jgi:membrane fusion protein (multidrug efflux system)
MTLASLRLPIAIALCLGLLAGLPACKKKEQAPAQRLPSPVSTITTQARDVPVDFEYVALTESSRQVNIQARIAGFLDRRVYTEGSMVREGQTLFVMDPKPLQAQVDQAVAALTANEAAHATAKANLERIKPLTAQNALSQKDLDDATGTFLTSQAAVAQSRAQLETARLNLSYATITSPVTGLSGSAQQADGTYISPTNSLLTTVFVLSPVWVNFSISENEAQSFREQVRNQRLRLPADGNYLVEILLVDGSSYPHQGRITFADPSFNSQTGTFQVRASVINPDGLLRPNQFVRVKVKGAVRPNAILVPQRAVQQGAKGHFVWLVKDGKAEFRPVKVGEWLGSDWFISEGLNKGEEVVVDGVLTLAPGAPVAAKPLAAAPAAPGAQGAAAAQATEAGKAKGPQAPADPLAPPLDKVPPAKAGAEPARQSGASTASSAPIKAVPGAGPQAPQRASGSREAKPAAKASVAVPPKPDRARDSSPQAMSAAATPVAAPAASPPQTSGAGAGRADTVAVHFAPDSAALSTVGRAVVDTTAALVKGRKVTVEVSGYVDRSGPPELNVELARRRAEAVRDALVSSGVPGGSVRLVKPADIVGAGDLVQARHVEIRVLAD